MTDTIEINPGGGGDIVGPGSSTDNAVARFDGTDGALLQNSVVIVSDTGNTTGFGTISSGEITSSSLTASKVLVSGSLKQIQSSSLTTTTLSNGLIAAIGITIDGGGSAITTGVKGYIYVPYACTINSVTMMADQSGSIVVDIWKVAYASFPPADGNSITASATPTITSTTNSQDTTLTGWTTAVTAGDVLAFNVDSATTVTRLNLILKVTKT